MFECRFSGLIDVFDLNHARCAGAHTLHDSSQRYYSVYRTCTQTSRQDIRQPYPHPDSSNSSNTKLPRPNTSKQEHAAIRALNKDKSIHIMSTNIGNATVFMCTTDSDHKVTDILSTDTYRRLPSNSCSVIERTPTAKFCTLYQAQVIDNTMYRHLKPSASA